MFWLLQLFLFLFFSGGEVFYFENEGVICDLCEKFLFGMIFSIGHWTVFIASSCILVQGVHVFIFCIFCRYQTVQVFILSEGVQPQSSHGRASAVAHRQLPLSMFHMQQGLHKTELLQRSQMSYCQGQDRSCRTDWRGG